MKLALAQINPTVGALRANSSKIAEFAQRAQRRGAELVIFPEMAVCGYPARDLVEKPEFVAESLAWLRRASQQVPGITLLCGCATPAAVSTGKSVHNTALAVRAGEVLFQQSKVLLPTYDVFDESRNFAPAEQQRVWRRPGPGGGQRIAVTICEDAWNDKNYWPKREARLLYARDPVEEQLRGGADFLINISASPYAVGKIALRQEMLGAIAREYRVPVVFVNQVGGNDQLIFDGGSMVLGEDGTLCARAAFFDEDLLIVDTSVWRGDVRPMPDAGAGVHENIAAMHQALVLGTRDYVRKCGLHKVVLGLSGGVDSAVTAALAVEALGVENVQALYLPARYSSSDSARDAEQVARNLGIRLTTHDIEPLFATALAALPGVERSGLAMQNLQPRLRALVLMARSNQEGALLLSTGNKSELAVGYCTLYGDMAGGLAVIADVLKTQVYALARYLNRNGEIIPQAVLVKAPTAELKLDQRDEDDLPPYPVLDAIIEQYVERYQSPLAIAENLALDAGLVQAMVRRIDQSEFKRQQAAPGLKVSRKAFGMGRRLPIAQRYEPVPVAPLPEVADPILETP